VDIALCEYMFSLTCFLSVAVDNVQYNATTGVFYALFLANR